MRTLGAIALLALVVAAATGAATLRDPRAEKVAPNAHDVALAKRITLTRPWLGAGWTQLRKPPMPPQTAFCPSFHPDLSRYTITGEAQTAFRGAVGSSIVSAVAVFRSRGDAAGDVRASTTRQSLACMTSSLRTQLQRALQGKGTARVVSATMRPLHGVGDRAVAYRLVSELHVAAGTARVYSHAFIIQRNRAQAALVLTGVGNPVALEMTYARELVYKMRLAK